MKFIKPEIEKTKLLSKKIEDSISTDLDPNLARVMLPSLLHHPKYLRGSFRLMRAVRKAKKARLAALKNGLKVPPFLIFSITSNCNLSCAGCFAAATGNVYRVNKESSNRIRTSLSSDQWRKIIREASDLGVMGFVIAGGEPFLFPGLIELCVEFRDRFFLILTNGTRITDKDYTLLKKSTNIAILVSVEGKAEFTDTRRGKGVYERAMDTLDRLSKLGVPNGISVTITRFNYRYWMNKENLDQLLNQGIRLGAFIEYIPLTPPPPSCSKQNQPNTYCTGLPEQDEKTNTWSVETDHLLILTPEERSRFRDQILHYRATKPIYLIHSPGDEEFFGGCVSAGRGFAHVTPNGDLTPCPVSNIATHNLTTSSLRDALASNLFKEIRDNEHLLEVEGTPCALFSHPKEVDELARAVGAYRTGIKLK